MNIFNDEKYFAKCLKWGSTLNFKLAGANGLLLFWLFFSCFATLTANLASISGKFSDFNFVNERLSDTVILICVTFHLSMLVKQKQNLATLEQYLLKPLRHSEADSSQGKIVMKYKRSVMICSISVCLILLMSFTSLILSPWYHLGSIDHFSTSKLPLPIGRLPWKPESYLTFGIFYMVSLTAMIVANLMYTSWFLTFIFSSLLVSTELDLLTLDLEIMNERVLKKKLMKLSRLQLTSAGQGWEHFKETNKIPGENGPKRAYNEELIIIKQINGCLKKIIINHVEIIRFVTLLEKTYRWIALCYIQLLVLLTSLFLAIIVDDWMTEETILFTRIDFIFGCLSFIFITCKSGQTIIDKSEKLSSALYNINWEDMPEVLRLNLLIMMTASHKPLRLTAGTIHRLNMVTFKKVMEGVYSYFNFLITLRQSAKN